MAYGETLVYSGPVYQGMKKDANVIRIAFTNIGGGLIIGTAPWRPAGNPPLSDAALAGFTLAGKDQKFVPANAVIQGDSVVVSSPEVSDPVAVRYAWADAPSCNLYNKEGLPAVPFRSDDWPQELPAAKPAAH